MKYSLLGVLILLFTAIICSGDSYALEVNVTNSRYYSINLKELQGNLKNLFKEVGINASSLTTVNNDLDVTKVGLSDAQVQVTTIEECSKIKKIYDKSLDICVDGDSDYSTLFTTLLCDKGQIIQLNAAGNAICASPSATACSCPSITKSYTGAAGNILSFVHPNATTCNQGYSGKVLDSYSNGWFIVTTIHTMNSICGKSGWFVVDKQASQ